MNLLAKNTLWAAAGQGTSVLVQAVYFIVVTRLLGSVEFGVYAGVMAMTAVVSQYSNLGSGYLLVRYAAVDPSQLRVYWGNVLLSIASAGVLVVVGVCCLGKILYHQTSIALLVTVAVSECIFLSIVNAAGQAFQSQERMRTTAFLNVSMNVIRLLTATYLLLSRGHSSALQWGYGVSLSSAVVAGGAFVLVTKTFGRPLFQPPLLFQRLFEGMSFSVSLSTTALYNDLDKILLTHYGFRSATGTYTAAYRVLSAANMPAYALYSSAYPKFFQLGSGGISKTAALARKLVAKSTPVVCLVCLILFISANLLARAFGLGFHDTGLQLRWLCLLPLLKSFQWSAGDALTGIGKQNVRLVLQGIAVVLNLALNLFLIPNYSWLGAVWSTLITDGFLAGVTWLAMMFLEGRDPKPKN